MPVISKSIIIHYSAHRTFLPQNAIVRFGTAPHLTIQFHKDREKIYLYRCFMANRQSALRIIYVFRLLPYERILVRYLSRFTGKFLSLKTSSHKVLTLKRILTPYEGKKNTLSLSTHTKVRFEGVWKYKFFIKFVYSNSSSRFIHLIFCCLLALPYTFNVKDTFLCPRISERDFTSHFLCMLNPSPTFQLHRQRNSDSYAN